MGTYFYFFPTAKQGRKVIWDGTDPNNNMKFLDHIPLPILKKKNETDMKITLANNSIIQIIGTDDYDSIMGTNPLGCVFSEFALQDPRAWGYIKPILTENKGWSFFNYTPRGKNHGWYMYNMAKNNPAWDCELLTVRDTFRSDGSPVITEEDIQADRDSDMDEDLIQQEYYCSFEASLVGAYYARQLARARQEKRIINIPHDPTLPVHTYWDLGGDGTAIWFIQYPSNNSIAVIDCYEASTKTIKASSDDETGMPHYVKVLKNKPYVYGSHTAPHDIGVNEWGTGKTRIEIGKSLGIDFQIAPKLARDEGIEAVKNVFPRCYFSSICEDGLNALGSYHREYVEKNRVMKTEPVHDWSSHYADAFRTFAVSPQVYNESIIISSGNRHNMNPDLLLSKYLSDYDPYAIDRL